MAYIVADRIAETTTGTGTGNLTLAGVLDVSYKAFSDVCANNDLFPALIIAVDASGNPTGAWETGVYTWTTGGVIQRTAVSESSNANAVVNFAAGTKRVYLTHVAKQFPYLESTGAIVLKNPATAPTIAETNALEYFAEKDAGIMLPRIVDENGIKDTFFIAPHENSSVFAWFPAAGTTGTGTGFGTQWTSNGTVTHPTRTATNKGTALCRTRWANVATTANQVLGTISTATRVWRGNAAGLGGFWFFARFSTALVPNATIRVFAGVCSVSPIATDSPTGDIAGLWHATTDSITTFNILTRDNVTSTKTAITVPTIAAGNWYEFTMTLMPNGNTLFYKLVDYLTGSVLANSSVTTTLPRADQFLFPAVQMSNGTANTTVTTVAPEVNSIYGRSLV